MSPEATHVAFDGDGGDLGVPSPAPAGARAPANTPAAATMNDAGGPVNVVAPEGAAALVHSHSPTASQEDVVEEVKSWFASVHSKLDLALSAISPGGHLRATTPARPAEKTPASRVPAEKTEEEAEEEGEGEVDSSPDALTASAQSPATLMGATGAVARLIEEALAAPDAPVFQPPAASPVSAWMARPRALVEALAEPLTCLLYTSPSPRDS